MVDLWQLNICLFCEKEFLIDYKSRQNVCFQEKCQKKAKKYIKAQKNGTY